MANLETSDKLEIVGQGFHADKKSLLSPLQSFSTELGTSRIAVVVQTIDSEDASQFDCSTQSR